MSNINSANIEKDFPEPGKDNDSAGFRNNFKSIADNFDIARTEVQDLQGNTARTDAANNFNQNDVANANFVACTDNVFDHGNIESNTIVSFSFGSYQKASVNADLSIILSDWPDTEKFAKITLELNNNSNNFYTVNWATEQAGEIRKNLGQEVNLTDSSVGDSTIGFSFTIGEFPDPLTLDPNGGIYILEFWTADGGSNVFANFIGEFANV